MNKPKLVFSAGHNSHQRGACHEDFCEYPETRLWVEELVKHFPAEDCAVITDMRLGDKIKFINEIKPVPILCIEIHFNSSVRGGNGSESLFTPSSEKSKMLAKFIQDRLGAISTPNRGIKEGWYKQDFDRKVPDAFLAQTRPVAVIIEPYFVQQGEKMVKENMVACCKAIADGIMEYLATISRTVTFTVPEPGA